MGGELEMIGSLKLKELVRFLVNLVSEDKGELDDMGSRLNARPVGKGACLVCAVVVVVVVVVG
jgi:hypothetical protein